MAKNPATEYEDHNSSFFSQFARLLPAELLERACSYKETRRGRPPKVSVKDLVIALVFHVMSGPGKLGGHLSMLTGKRLSEGTLSDRRGSLPWQVFERIMDWGLRPVAQEEKHPEAFHKPKSGS